MSTTMTRAELVERLRKLAADHAAVDPATVTEATHLFDDLNFDSLDAVEFTMTLEEEFEVNIADDQAEQVKTIGQAADMLVSMQG